MDKEIPEKAFSEKLDSISSQQDAEANRNTFYRGPAADPASEKNIPTVTVETEFSGWNRLTKIGSFAHKSDSGQSWMTTLIRFGPLSGIFSMLIAIASIVSALGILAGSDGEAVDKWSAPPSTYLAIFTAVANLSVRYAAMHGVVIAWWYRASQPEGATLEKLHYNWLAGSSLLRALSAGRHMGLLGLACIFSTVVVIASSLAYLISTVYKYAPSSKVHAAPWINESVSLNVSMAQELPRFFGGGYAITAKDLGIAHHWSYAFNNTIPTGYGGNASNNLFPSTGTSATNNLIPDLGRLLRANAPLAGLVNGCPDTCTAKVRAPALAMMACTTQLIPVNYNDIPYIKNNAIFDGLPPAIDAHLFSISTGLVLDGERESFNLVTAYPIYTNKEMCSGHLNMTACTFVSAVGEYTVEIADGKASFVDAENPTIVALANNTTPDPNVNSLGQRPSTLAAMVELAWERYDNIIAFYKMSNGKIGSLNDGQGIAAAREFVVPVSSSCPDYSDPLSYVVRNLNNMMVWSGAVVANQNATYRAYLESQMDGGLPMNTPVTGYRIGDHSVFHTDYAYFVAAALVELICIGLIAPTYWGWWRLGRDVSFSPLEIAKAFRSPILAEHSSNSRGGHIASVGRKTLLRYGSVSGDSGVHANELAFATPDSVSGLGNGVRFAR